MSKINTIRVLKWDKLLEPDLNDVAFAIITSKAVLIGSFHYGKK